MSRRIAVPIAALAVLLTASGCAPGDPWEPAESEYGGAMTLDDVRWEVVQAASRMELTWTFDVVNDSGYLWEGEYGVGVEVSAYDAAGRLVARDTTSQATVGPGRHPYTGRTEVGGVPAVVKLRFIDA